MQKLFFSQFLSFSMTDLLLYGEFCMIRHNYVNIVPGMMTVGCQLLAAVCWALIGKRFTIAFGKPEKTLVISGADDVDEFLQKFGKIKHIFSIEKVVSADILKSDWKKEVDPYRAIIFYEVSSRKARGRLFGTACRAARVSMSHRSLVRSPWKALERAI